MYLSEEIDEEYEEVRAAKIAQFIAAQAAAEAELRYIFQDDTDTERLGLPSTYTTTGISVSRSGTIRQTKSVDAIATQNDIYIVNQPPVRTPS